MSSERLRRVERILVIREKALDQAKTALSVAVRKTQEAEARKRGADHAWEECVNALARGDVGTIDDFKSQREHLDGLKRTANYLTKLLEEAKMNEDKVREVMTKAKREMRKMELLKETILEQERKEADRRERIATDEVAARIAGRAP